VADFTNSPAVEQVVLYLEGSHIDISKTQFKVDLESLKPVCGLETFITAPVPESPSAGIGSSRHRPCDLECRQTESLNAPDIFFVI